MFSIAAINDTTSLGQWEALAPTKEAQEFHLTQTYHDGLLKLHAKEYEKAQELLESVLKDPLISNAQAVSSASDDHLLQIRFLALKNLATVFLEQGSSHYESAIRCYLQAVEIDTKDTVIWNKLGTLACSMGSLSISRWAFEQGLVCSPNNWNCMEKLLEVLIAIGDELACLSVADLILRHWPSHSRALHVKNTIEEPEPLPFKPKGIDKLEPKHARLKFLDKRKSVNENLDESRPSKKLNQNLELYLREATWASLADALLEILPQVGRSDSQAETGNIPRNTRLVIHLPSISETFIETQQSKEINLNIGVDEMAIGHCSPESGSISKEKYGMISDEQRQERRSARRLERLKSLKPGEEELIFSTGNDRAKVVMQFLEPFIVSEQTPKESDSSDTSIPFPDDVYTLDMECSDVSKFVRETSINYGAYHMAQLLLEEAASRCRLYQDHACVKFLDLEKVTRQLQKDRSPECYLFLAELYHDLGLADVSKLSDCMLDVSYLLCKIIEMTALDYPFPSSGIFGKGNFSAMNKSQDTSKQSTNKGAFWVRFFWLSGRLSFFEGNKAKSNEEFCVCLSFLAKKENMDDPDWSVHLPHCKFANDLTIDRILHEIELLKVDFLMKTTVVELIEKEMYLECINLLAPLLFSSKGGNFGVLTNKEDEVTSLELSALDVLIKACEKTKPMDMELYLNCHRRKLQILIMSAGMEEGIALCKSFHKGSGSRTLFGTEDSKQNPNKLLNHLVAKEVKDISHCASQIKKTLDECGDNKGVAVPLNIVGDIQYLLLAVMCNIASLFLHKKSSEATSADPIEEKHEYLFVDTTISFCKLQHLNQTVSLKMQVDLIVAIHDLLAEYGICCASNDAQGEEGMFLKLAIKYLLANKGRPHKRLLSSSNDVIPFSNEANVNELKVECVRAEIDPSSAKEKDVLEDSSFKAISTHEYLENHKGVEFEQQGCKVSDGNSDNSEKPGDPLTEGERELTEVERADLEEGIDNALDQCFFCLYGLNLRSEACYEDELVTHKNSSRGDYQTKEQCADVFQYVLSYAKNSSKTGLIKLRRVLRAIRKHFPQPPEDVLSGNAIDKFLDDPNLSEEKLSEAAGSDVFFDFIMKIIFPDAGSIKKYNTPSFGSSDPYYEVYSNLYYLLAQSEDMSATDKWPGFVLAKEGEEFVQQNANLFKYDLLYNPLRFEGWQRLANIFDEEVDLLLNDGSKHINVTGWRKNATFAERVETSRRRSRRCLLVSLALAKTSAQQCEIHELLALVYYDGIQNVAPIYDQRFVVRSKDTVWKMFSMNSMKHFEKAFAHRQDWSHAFYMGKLSEKLGYSHEISFSYYYKAIALNPSAVDSVYRLHASRLKLLSTCGKQNLEAMKVVTEYSQNEATKDTVLKIFRNMDSASHHLEIDLNENSMQISPGGKISEESRQLGEVWHMLYDDCLSAIEMCVEGDLKHFHKARYVLAEGIYRRGESGDLAKAKDELSFCFKSSRSSFTINMWEIDGMIKKGRRKTPGVTGNKKSLEVNLPESSRKFITCLRKYILFYLKLLEETGDVSTLDRAYISLRTDKRFSMCLEDLIPVVVGRYIKALISSMQQAEVTGSDVASSSQHQLEKIFTLFTEQVSLWPDICSLPEITSPDWSENKLCGYLYQYVQSLERNNKLETLEVINDKIRKRFKNPKLSNSNCAKVCRHASIAWCRSLIISLALITKPSSSGSSGATQEHYSSDGVSDNPHLLLIDIKTDELWSSSFEDPAYLKCLETKWRPILSEINNVVVKKVAEENLEMANNLLKCAYNFYRDSSCVTLSYGINLFLMASSRLAAETQFNPGLQGVEVLDLSIPRKLLVWAYALLYGRFANIAAVVKHCEETLKLRMKKGCGTITNLPIATYTGGGKDAGDCLSGGENETTPMVIVALASVQPEGGRTPSEHHKSSFTTSTTAAAQLLHNCNSKPVAEKGKAEARNPAKEN